MSTPDTDSDYGDESATSALKSRGKYGLRMLGGDTGLLVPQLQGPVNVNAINAQLHAHARNIRATGATTMQVTPINSAPLADTYTGKITRDREWLVLEVRAVSRGRPSVLCRATPSDDWPEDSNDFLTRCYTAEVIGPMPVANRCLFDSGVVSVGGLLPATAQSLFHMAERFPGTTAWVSMAVEVDLTKRSGKCASYSGAYHPESGAFILHRFAQSTLPGDDPRITTPRSARDARTIASPLGSARSAARRPSSAAAASTAAAAPVPRGPARALHVHKGRTAASQLQAVPSELLSPLSVVRSPHSGSVTALAPYRSMEHAKQVAAEVLTAQQAQAAMSGTETAAAVVMFDMRDVPVLQGLVPRNETADASASPRDDSDDGSDDSYDSDSSSCNMGSSSGSSTASNASGRRQPASVYDIASDSSSVIDAAELGFSSDEDATAAAAHAPKQQLAALPGRKRPRARMSTLRSPAELQREAVPRGPDSDSSDGRHTPEQSPADSAAEYDAAAAIAQSPNHFALAEQVRAEKFRQAALACCAVEADVDVDWSALDMFPLHISQSMVSLRCKGHRLAARQASALGSMRLSRQLMTRYSARTMPHMTLKLTQDSALELPHVGAIFQAWDDVASAAFRRELRLPGLPLLRPKAAEFPPQIQALFESQAPVNVCTMFSVVLMLSRLVTCSLSRARRHPSAFEQLCGTFVNASVSSLVVAFVAALGWRMIASRTAGPAVFVQAALAAQFNHKILRKYAREQVYAAVRAARAATAHTLPGTATASTSVTESNFFDASTP